MEEEPEAGSISEEEAGSTDIKLEAASEDDQLPRDCGDGASRSASNATDRCISPPPSGNEERVGDEEICELFETPGRRHETTYIVEEYRHWQASKYKFATSRESVYLSDSPADERTKIVAKNTTPCRRTDSLESGAETQSRCSIQDVPGKPLNVSRQLGEGLDATHLTLVSDEATLPVGNPSSSTRVAESSQITQPTPRRSVKGLLTFFSLAPPGAATSNTDGRHDVRSKQPNSRPGSELRVFHPDAPTQCERFSSQKPANLRPNFKATPPTRRVPCSVKKTQSVSRGTPQKDSRAPTPCKLDQKATPKASVINSARSRTPDTLNSTNYAVRCDDVTLGRMEAGNTEAMSRCSLVNSGRVSAARRNGRGLTSFAVEPDAKLKHQSPSTRSSNGHLHKALSLVTQVDSPVTPSIRQLTDIAPSTPTVARCKTRSPSQYVSRRQTASVPAKPVQTSKRRSSVKSLDASLADDECSDFDATPYSSPSVPARSLYQRHSAKKVVNPFVQPQVVERKETLEHNVDGPCVNGSSPVSVDYRRSRKYTSHYTPKRNQTMGWKDNDWQHGNRRSPDAAATIQRNRRSPDAAATIQRNRRSPDAASTIQRNRRSPDAAATIQRNRRSPDAAATIQRNRRSPDAASTIQRNRRSPDAAATIQRNRRSPDAATTTQRYRRSPDAASTIQQNRRSPDAASTIQQNRRSPDAASTIQQNRRSPDAASTIQLNVGSPKASGPPSRVTTSRSSFALPDKTAVLTNGKTSPNPGTSRPDRVSTFDDNSNRKSTTLPARRPRAEQGTKLSCAEDKKGTQTDAGKGASATRLQTIHRAKAKHFHENCAIDEASSNVKACNILTPDGTPTKLTPTSRRNLNSKTCSTPVPLDHLSRLNENSPHQSSPAARSKFVAMRHSGSPSVIFAKLKLQSPSTRSSNGNMDKDSTFAIPLPTEDTRPNGTVRQMGVHSSDLPTSVATAVPGRIVPEPARHCKQSLSSKKERDVVSSMTTDRPRAMSKQNDSATWKHDMRLLDKSKPGVSPQRDTGFVGKGPTGHGRYVGSPSSCRSSGKHDDRTWAEESRSRKRLGFRNPNDNNSEHQSSNQQRVIRTTDDDPCQRTTVDARVRQRDTTASEKERLLKQSTERLTRVDSVVSQKNTRRVPVFRTSSPIEDGDVVESESDALSISCLSSIHCTAKVTVSSSGVNRRLVPVIRQHPVNPISSDSDRVSAASRRSTVIVLDSDNSDGGHEDTFSTLVDSPLAKQCQPSRHGAPSVVRSDSGFDVYEFSEGGDVDSPVNSPRAKTAVSRHGSRTKKSTAGQLTHQNHVPERPDDNGQKELTPLRRHPIEADTVRRMVSRSCHVLPSNVTDGRYMERGDSGRHSTRLKRARCDDTMRSYNSPAKRANVSLPLDRTDSPMRPHVKISKPSSVCQQRKVDMRISSCPGPGRCKKPFCFACVTVGN